ncbi:MAG: hypothetical protein J0H49_11425, partial [Acidobacteria bacterium]|nr:hypothetical protein [Acidobacteriota bacterium]
WIGMLPEVNLAEDKGREERRKKWLCSAKVPWLASPPGCDAIRALCGVEVRDSKIGLGAD